MRFILFYFYFVTFSFSCFIVFSVLCVFMYRPIVIWVELPEINLMMMMMMMKSRFSVTG